jgi:hypothetical protein
MHMGSILIEAEKPIHLLVVAPSKRACKHAMGEFTMMFDVPLSAIHWRTHDGSGWDNSCGERAGECQDVTAPHWHMVKVVTK